MWLVVPLLVMVSYLATVTGSVNFFIFYAALSLAVPLVFKRYRFVFLFFLLATVCLVTMSGLRNDEYFLEEKIFSVRDEIKSAYSALKEELYNNRNSIIGSKLSEKGDIGYTVYDDKGILLEWSGKADFSDDAVHVTYPKLFLRDNDVSLRFRVYDRGRVCFIRMHITNVYSTSSTVSGWLKRIQDKYDMNVTMYFTPGQFYVYEEPILYNELKDVESVYLKSTDSLYSMIDDGIALKIERKRLADYFRETTSRFFILTCLLACIIALVRLEGENRFFIWSFTAFLLNLMMGLINPVFLTLALIFFFLNRKKMAAMPAAAGGFIGEYLKIASPLMATVIAGGLYYRAFMDDGGKIAFWIGRITFSNIIATTSIVLFFSILHILYRKTSLAFDMITAIAFVAAVAFLGGITAAFFIAALLLCALARAISLPAGRIKVVAVVFISLSAVFFTAAQGLPHEAFKRIMEKIENEPAALMLKTAENLRTDQVFLWSLKNNLHYDDENLTFFKWLRSPLSRRDYASFMYFKDSNGKLINRYANDCDIAEYVTSPGRVVQKGRFHIYSVSLFYEDDRVGDVVLGIKDDFFLNMDRDTEIYFEHMRDGERVFTTMIYEDTGYSGYSENIIANDADTYRIMVKPVFPIVLKNIFVIVILLALGAALIVVIKKDIKRELGDFVKKNIFVLLLLMAIPFASNFILLSSGFLHDIRIYLRTKLSDQKEEFLKITEDFTEGRHGETDILGRTELAESLNKELRGWHIYKGPLHVNSFDYDSYRANMEESRLGVAETRKLDMEGESYSASPLDYEMNYIFTLKGFPGYYAKLTYVMNRIEVRTFYERLILNLFLQFFLLAFIIVIIFRNVNKVLRPLSDIIVATKEVSYGNLNYELKTDTKIPELKVLFVNFNNMVKRIGLLKRSLEDNRNYLNDMIKSLPIGAVTYDEHGRVKVFNHEILSFGGSISYKSRVSDVFSFDIDYMAEGEGEIKKGGLIFRYIIRKFKYGYIFMIFDITNLILTEKFDVWLQMTQEIAHELKNPLMPIKFSLNRVSKSIRGSRMIPERKADLEELINIIREETDSIQDIVDRFREHAIDGEKELGRIDVMERLAKVSQSFDTLEFSRSASALLPVIYFSPAKFDLLFKNIFENIVETDADSRAVEIAVYTDRSGNSGDDFLVIHVRDYAGGVRDELLDRIFEPYFSDKKGGSGLGMYLVKKYMTQYGGDVKIEVRPGEGLDIYLYFEVKK